MIALADRGFYEGEQLRTCAEAGMVPMVPKRITSPAQALGFRGKATFVYQPETYNSRLGEAPTSQHVTLFSGLLPLQIGLILDFERAFSTFNRFRREPQFLPRRQPCSINGR